MKAYLKFFAVSLLFATCVSELPAQLNSKPTDEDSITLSTKEDAVSLSITIPKKCVAGTSFALTCILDNQGKNAIRYFISGRHDVFEIQIVDSHGKDVPVTRFGALNRPEPLGVQITQEILPGKKVIIPVPLARLYDLTVADTYTMTIRRRVTQTAGKPISLVIGKIKLKVEEPKEARPKS
jgi:hypothetical protein